MTTNRLLIFLMVHLSCTLFAQDDVTEIFDDLVELGPVLSTEPAAPEPDETKADPVPAPQSVVVEMPQKQIPAPATHSGIMSPVPVQEKIIPPMDIQKTLARGKKAYGDDDWNLAQQLFEAVLYTDEYNKSAIKWLKRIANKKAGCEEQRFDTTRARMLKEVQAAWNTPKSKGRQPGVSDSAHEPTSDDLHIAALRKKLKTIHIPSITFQNADVQQVVLELSAMCRKFDGEGKGLNLIVFGTSETLLPPVTFSGTDLSVLETLDIITQMSGMKYNIGPNRVSLTPVNYEPPQQMVSAEFDVMPSVAGKIMLRSGEDSASGLVDVHTFFGSIPFPPGSCAQLNPEFNLLLIHNVPKHIDKVEALLNRYNQKALEEHSQQVEIETKFIEVTQGELEELGFEWTVGEAGTYLNNDTVSVPGGQKIFTDTLRTGEEALSSSIDTAGRATSFNSYTKLI